MSWCPNTLAQCACSKSAISSGFEVACPSAVVIAWMPVRCVLRVSFVSLWLMLFRFTCICCSWESGAASWKARMSFNSSCLSNSTAFALRPAKHADIFDGLSGNAACQA